ncbi:response regulator [Stigmatella aurantiaca]|uniref:Response regulator n=1 Tax=Stigmatella aurantiaca (strain DW4/3-1) TaxID=378806 RepID=E3FXB2_STIAD|nr:response regulator [Stigmatella aurantiaca]ADO72351.1 Response regulator [Stigmatella aurantiaca DW4/3-1]
MRGTVLLLEDDADVREAVAGVLEDAGFQVATAANGKEGLNVLAQNTSPCVIVLDLWMPVLSGREFLEQLREEPQKSALPVVLMTASDSTPPPGVAACLRKPFGVSQLVKVVEKHCLKAGRAA